MSRLAHRARQDARPVECAPPRLRPAQGCARCGGEREAVVSVQVRPASGRGGALLSTRARGLCDGCALDVLEVLEARLDRALEGFVSSRPELAALGTPGAS